MEDLALILNNENVSEDVKKNAINYAIYNWTEANGKYEGNKYWSEKAYINYAYKDNRPYKLVHEHIIPRKIIREKIFNELEEQKIKNKSKLDSLSLYLLFSRFVVAAVITKDEDDMFRNSYDGIKLRSKMPQGYNILQKNREHWYENVWARYFAVNEKALKEENKIIIYDVTWNGSIDKDYRICLSGFTPRDVLDNLLEH